MIPSSVASAFSAFLAQAPAGGSGGLLGNPMLMMGLMIVMFYFILIRPQRMRQKEQDKMQSGLRVGDQVVTHGGEHGLITSVKDRTVMIKVADNVKIEYDRSAVASVLKKTDVVDATTV
jgi:preprotein translocase subunit YajC